MIKLGTKLPATHHNGLRAGIVVLILVCLLGGCATYASTDHQNTVIALANKVQALENQLIATQAAIASLNSNQLTSQKTLSKQLTKLNDDIDKIRHDAANVS